MSRARTPLSSPSLTLSANGPNSTAANTPETRREERDTVVDTDKDMGQAQPPTTHRRAKEKGKVALQ